MKKFFVFFVVGLILVAGCSKHEPTAPEKKAEKLYAAFFSDPTGAKLFYGVSDSLVTPDSVEVTRTQRVKGDLVFPGYDTTKVDVIGPGHYEFTLSRTLVIRDTATVHDTTFVPTKPDTVPVPGDTVYVDTTKTDTTRLPGWLVINANSTTTGATVYLNGQNVGLISAPEFRDTLNVGYYNLKVSRQGYQDFTALAEIEENKPTVYNPWLVEIQGPPPPPDSTGQLSVSSIPDGAEVFLDGSRWPNGETYTPTGVQTTIVGDHEVRVQKYGFKPWVSKVTIEPGKLTVLNPELVADPTTGLLSVDSDPDGAVVYLDGSRWPNADTYTPTGVQTTTVGDHELKLVKEGYREFVVTITIEAGKLTTMNPYLEKLGDDGGDEPGPSNDAWVDLQITPENTTIRIDGHLWGEGVRWIQPGNHHVVVSKEGFVSQERNFTATVGDTVVVKIDLVEENPEEPACFQMESDGDYLYFSVAEIDALGWVKVVFNGSSHDLFEVLFSAMTKEEGNYKFRLNDLPYEDYRIFTLVDENSHWYSKRDDCHPEMIGINFDTEPIHENWYNFLWNKLEPPPVDSYVDLRITPDHTTIHMDGKSWGEGVSWIASGNHAVTVSKTGYITQTRQFTVAVGCTTKVEINLEKEAPPPPTMAYLIVRVNTPDDCMVKLNSNLWCDDCGRDIDPGSYTLEVSKTGYQTYSESFQAAAGDTILIEVSLEEEPPPPPPANPLRVEYTDGKVKLYGTGKEKWFGLEMYDPDQNETTGWINNHWVKGTDKGDYTEFTRPDARLSHGVFWKDCTPGKEGQGGKGIQPRFADWANLQKGTGVSQINVNPGYFVIQH